MLVSLDEFKEFVGSTGTTYDSLMTAALAAGEREVIRHCHRSTAYTGFEQSSGLTRYYRPEDIIDLPYGSQYKPSIGGVKSWDVWEGSVQGTHTVLWLGDADLLSVSALTNGDGSVLSSTSYWLEPRNNGSTGNGKPFAYVRLRSDAAWSFDTDGEIAVTGNWGYSTGPDPSVVWAVEEVAKYLLDARLAGTADVTAMPELGQMTIPQGFPKHVDTMLRKGGYVRTRGAY